MKIFVAILCSLFLFLNQDLSSLRESYINASKSKESAEYFNNLVSKNKSDKAIILAYKGAGMALKAKFTTNKKEKKDFFVEGVSKIENAVKKDPDNIEIRIIRLSIQENTPKILKYKSNIPEDKAIIISNFANQSVDLKEYIKIYIKQSKVFSEVEKSKMFN